VYVIKFDVPSLSLALPWLLRMKREYVYVRVSMSVFLYDGSHNVCVYACVRV